ncbi:UNVERIFIED_CONTAM: carboxylesterase [Acetivibrio alkalicellulosi]
MNSKIGCLIIHGFGQSLGEVQPLSKYLRARGFMTFCPLLEDGASENRQFSALNYPKWIKSAEEGFKYLKSKCNYVVIIGFSMGGLIAMNLSLKYKILGIATLNTPIYHLDIRNIYLNILIDLITGKFANLKRYIKALTSFDVCAFLNYKILLQKTKSEFEKIKCPIFIGQGLFNDIVNCKSALYIFKKTSSKYKNLKYYQRASHILSFSSVDNKLFCDIENFIIEIKRMENDTGNLFSFSLLNGTYNK